MPPIAVNPTAVELAASLHDAMHAHAYVRLHEQADGAAAQDLADALQLLPLDGQVLAFKTLSRRKAASVFEYLPLACQEDLVKAMAHEDVQGLLNQMAPDDRTLFLSELPANATKQLLALLTPEEHAEAVTLLGYEAGTVGRLMTPHYVAVRESWTIQEVLDYVRQHGRDSETLNVIYVVDGRGVLIDDVRMRECLVRPLDDLVSQLMDRRFVTLTATDHEEAAVAVFRREDRTALPVVDTAGVLIGVVTIDDVLDVAEQAATRDIQKIGGSEALDQPYMAVGLVEMIRKRA